MCNCQDTLIPQIGVVTDICTETADVKTFRVEKIGGGKLFEHLPGQCAILSVPGKGEAIFSITSSPTNEKYMEFSIKRCGSVTNFLILNPVSRLRCADLTAIISLLRIS